MRNLTFNSIALYPKAMIRVTIDYSVKHYYEGYRAIELEASLGIIYSVANTEEM